MAMRPDMSLEEMLAGFIFVAHGSRVVWVLDNWNVHWQALKRGSYTMTDLERYFALNGGLTRWLKHPQRLSAATFQEAEAVARQVLHNRNRPA